MDDPAAVFARPRINVLGVGISHLNLDVARDALVAAAQAGRKGYVCVATVHGVMECHDDAGLRDIFNYSLLTTPDGMPLVWAGRLEKREAMGRVYGPDLMLELCRVSPGLGLRHFLYGGRERVAGELRDSLTRRFPGLEIVGTYTPPFRDLNAEEFAELQAQVAAAKPHFFWVGISTPKQERFMAKYHQRLDANIFLGVGAAFDFHTGRVAQAPAALQRAGLEWAYRLYREPRRLWYRYLYHNPRYLTLFALQKLGLRTVPLPPSTDAE